jgi:hypothetical protein
MLVHEDVEAWHACVPYAKLFAGDWLEAADRNVGEMGSHSLSFSAIAHVGDRRCEGRLLIHSASYGELKRADTPKQAADQSEPGVMARIALHSRRTEAPRAKARLISSLKPAS